VQCRIASRRPPRAATTWWPTTRRGHWPRTMMPITVVCCKSTLEYFPMHLTTTSIRLSRVVKPLSAYCILHVVPFGVPPVRHFTVSPSHFPLRPSFRWIFRRSDVELRTLTMPMPCKPCWKGQVSGISASTGSPADRCGPRWPGLRRCVLIAGGPFLGGWVRVGQGQLSFVVLGATTDRASPRFSGLFTSSSTSRNKCRDGGVWKRPAGLACFGSSPSPSLPGLYHSVSQTVPLPAASWTLAEVSSWKSGPTRSESTRTGLHSLGQGIQ